MGTQDLLLDPGQPPGQIGDLATKLGAILDETQDIRDVGGSLARAPRRILGGAKLGNVLLPLRFARRMPGWK